MAAAPTGQEADKKSGGFSLVAFILVTIIGGGGGAFFALQIPALTNSGASHKERSAAPKEHSEETFSPIVDLAPITTNLAEPVGTWVRLEASVVVKEDLGPDKDVLLRTVSEDIIAYFRTVKLNDLNGPSAFLHMREDLNDRIRIRSQNKLSGIIIQSFILE